MKIKFFYLSLMDLIKFSLIDRPCLLGSENNIYKVGAALRGLIVFLKERFKNFFFYRATLKGSKRLMAGNHTS